MGQAISDALQLDYHVPRNVPDGCWTRCQQYPSARQKVRRQNSSINESRELQPNEHQREKRQMILKKAPMKRARSPRWLRNAPNCSLPFASGFGSGPCTLFIPTPDSRYIYLHLGAVCAAISGTIDASLGWSVETHQFFRVLARPRARIILACIPGDVDPWTRA
jgi:hypothetical protein